jgi:aspartyl-tRNA(Asn)/glutamyl-tRNA(Gln) amidotransferase subunit A
MTASRDAVERCLARIADPAGEGARAFVALAPDRARAEADAQDAMRRAGVPLGPLAGMVLSVKDLADVCGEVTKAGSLVLAQAAPAAADAPVVARLRRAGAIAVGRTHMTEFAYSGVGYNPHYPTPASPWDRQTRRVPGGSSSGAGVSVADGMADIGLGTDTGGSIRLPAGVNGVVGFKPTAARVPAAGIFPLSQSLDSVGPLTRSVALAALADAVMAGEEPRPLTDLPLKGLRFFVPVTHVLDDLDPLVATTYEKFLSDIAAAGAVLTEGPVPGMEARQAFARQGGLVSAEAWTIHRDLLATGADRYDPRVRSRLAFGQAHSASDYIGFLAARKAFQAAWAPVLAQVDAVLMPTLPILPPALADVETDDAEFTRVNGLMLRNTSLINVLDGCGVALPLTPTGEAPVSVTLAGGAFSDRHILAAAQAVERFLALG